MSIIRSYGLFWKVQDVFWGKGSQAGSLLGVPAGARTAVPTDFREQIGIYVLYSDHQMIYVGQTGSGEKRLFRRLKDHRKDRLADRWNQFSWFGLRGALARGGLSTEKLRTSAGISVALNHIEAVLIEAAEPVRNKQGGRFGDNVQRFIQARDERLGPSDTEMIREIWEQIQE